MNTELRGISVVVLLLALMGSDLQAELPNQAEQEAVAAIREGSFPIPG